MNEEKTWILQAKNGSDEAFTYIVETYQTPVYNLCYRMLGESEAAEDAAQETFLRAYQHLHRYDIKRLFCDLATLDRSPLLYRPPQTTKVAHLSR